MIAVTARNAPSIVRNAMSARIATRRPRSSRAYRSATRTRQWTSRAMSCTGRQFPVQCDREFDDIRLFEQLFDARVVHLGAGPRLLTERIEHLQNRREFLFGEEIDLQIQVRA